MSAVNSRFRYTRLVLGISLIVSVLAAAACRIGADDPIGVSDAVSEQVVSQPFLSSLSGSGTLYREVESEPLQAGMRLQDGDVVHLDAGAVAFLQHEDTALARFEGPADFEVRLHTRNGESVLTVMLGSGTTIVRRRPEATQHRIRVQTDAGIVEPEGTSFRVSREQESTTVQVASGRVRVLASSVDPDELRAVTEIQEILDVLDEIEDTSVFVDADGMVLLRPQDVSTASEILSDMRDQLARSGVAGSPDDATVRTIQTVLRYAATRMSQTRPEVTQITVSERTAILDRAPTRLLPPVPENGIAGRSAPARLTIQTDPPDAEILLDGVPIGNSIFSGLFEPGEEVSIEVRAPGYESRVLEVEFTPDLDERLLVSLERRRPSMTREHFFQRLRQGDRETVRQWLAAGGDPDVQNARGVPALAVAFGAERSLQDLLGSFRPSVEIVELLLDAGAYPDSRFEVEASTFTPLTAVVLSGLFRDEVRMDLVDMLLNANASPDIVLETGEMRVTALTLPLIIGIERGDVDLALLGRFIEAGADVHAAAFYEGRVLSPLAMALVLGAESNYDPADAVSMLVAAGARTSDRIRVQGTIWTPVEFAEHAGLSESAGVLRAAQL